MMYINLIKMNNINIDVYDPYASKEEVSNKYNINLLNIIKLKKNIMIVS